MGDDNNGKPARMTSIVLNTACRHFRGSRPCTFNKLDGSECATCRHTSEYRDRILFVKLDAIGEIADFDGLIHKTATLDIDQLVDAVLAQLDRRAS